MALLVRTWNVFHGNASPPERRSFLKEIVQLATEDDPDVLCLQELPVWALGHLDDWSGMHSFGAVAARPLLGSAERGRVITQLHHGLLRSAGGAGQRDPRKPKLRPLGSDSIVLNPRGFRRSRGVNEPSRGSAARTSDASATQSAADERQLTVANLHDSSVPDWRVPDSELLRAAVFAESFAEPGEILVLAGDFNVIRERSETMEQLTSPAWGFSRPISGIDQILVRSASSGHAKRWRDERRRLGGRLLSDHAPVEVTIE